MAAFFRNSVNKVAAQSSPSPFQQNEQALYQALRDNNQQAWDYLMIQVHNQFVVPQSRQSYDYDTLISAYAEGMAIVKDNILTGRFSHEKAKVTTYAYSVCRYTLLTMYDKDKRRQEVSPFAEQAADDADESSDLSGDNKAEWLLQNEVDDHSWALEPLKIALSSLKDRCQTILQLFYVDNVPDREAARQLGINEANLRQQRRNCVLSLRQSFNQLKKSYL